LLLPKVGLKGRELIRQLLVEYGFDVGHLAERRAHMSASAKRD
jgi:hypothetical protein